MAPRSTLALWYDRLRYHIVPPLFLVVFTSLPQILALVGRGETPTWQAASRTSLGNCFSWTCLAVFYVWAAVWLQLPSKQHYGPTTLFGYRPQYQDNGLLYYWASIFAFLAVSVWQPGFCSRLFDNIPSLLGCCSLASILICAALWIKGKLFLEHPGDKQENKPILFEFYRGMELHPRLLGMDIKQLTNCRIGMMAWQLLVLTFYIASVERHGFNAAMLVNMLLQSVYIGKFFLWETGYFNTLDIILDRAGYYICWGCLSWVPCLYTFSSYYLVIHTPVLSNMAAVLLGLIGLAAILLNYRVDVEKQLFRANNSVLLWGRPCSYVIAKYRDDKGKIRESKLLTSGCWGVARHLNYLFELVAALAWCMPGYGLSGWPFAYFFFLVLLLVHRTFRDEEKCRNKYAADWDKYCKEVPYRIIPYVF